MELVFKEIVYWLGFIAFNGIIYLINYIFDFKKSDFLPYFKQFRETRKFGLAVSNNQDIFRYSVEFSFLLLLSRLIHLNFFSWGITFFYILILFFNIYQYSFRKIYNSEPNFFSDSKLIKNGLAIIWHESKWKVLVWLLLLPLIIFLIHLGLSSFLTFSYFHPITFIFHFITSIWLLTLLWAIYKVGFYLAYPNDIYNRYHFTMVEIYQNLNRSLINYQISRTKTGKQFSESRKKIQFKLKENPPNLHFIFVESYGSYFFKDESLKKKSFHLLNTFVENISKNNWSAISNFTASPTTGGQSWLTYSSFLFGLKISDNTYFENYFNDPDFNQSNSLMRILKNAGYTNYNLNPIRPIKGINVPYEKMRSFYCIDRWILNDSMDYQGDVYGFGESPPDQYSMNYTMELIKKEKANPYTFFYLTKNSHSPFIPPPLIDDWKELNHPNGSVHVHKGFLKYPNNDDYCNAITYEFENLTRFINDHGQQNDIFLIIGDHQPPILSKPEQHGCETPVHVISKNRDFLNTFKAYGFEKNLQECKTSTKHEALFSIFLRAFMKEYAKDYDNLPDFEPDGLIL